jgi:hypothetical protein
MLERLLSELLTPLIAIPLIPLEHAIVEAWRRRRTESWPTTQATVHAGRTWKSGHLWSGEVAYSYRVSGEFYSGFSRLNFARESDAEQWVGCFPPRMPLFVRYAPEHPDKSVLRRDDNPMLRFS